MKATVLSTANNLSKVLCEDGKVLLCPIKGKRLKGVEGSYNALAAGDRVEVRPTEGGRGLVLGLEPRRNSFGRFNEKGKAAQAIAANVDRVVCVCSPLLPPFRPRFVDRLAVMAESASLPFFVVLNKIDLGVESEIEERLAWYEDLGYRSLRTSALTGEGLSELASVLASGVSVLAGQSGSGKSSLLNALYPGLGRRTQEVSEKYERGRHTTTLAEAVLAEPGRLVIDTPGFRRLSLKSLDLELLPHCFPEFRSFAEDCVLGSACSHVDESGCRVREAAEAGEIHADRYESYLRIRDELSAPAEWRRAGPRDPGRRHRALLPGRKRLGKVIDPFDEEEEY